MAGLNKAILIGRVGADPIVRTLDSNVKVMNLRMATTESYRDRDGNWQDQTEWHNVVGYRYLAEKNIAKGDLVYVEGKIRNRSYTDKDGVEKYISEILADKINILTRSQQNERSPAYASEISDEPDSGSADAEGYSDEKDDSGGLPF